MKIEYIKLDEALTFDEVKQYTKLLPFERQEKIARYRFERDKLLSLAAGLLIRRAVGDSRILVKEHGKPYVPGGVYFSVSHSGEMAAIAVDHVEVGLDIERFPEESRLKIADRFYHPGERAYVSGSPDVRRAFCEIWTRKEAYLKMTGEGISTDLTAFDTTASPLCEQLYTTVIGEYALSLCSEKVIKYQNIDISKLELKDVL